MTDQPKMSPDQFMELAAAAVQIRQMFEAYLSAGFTEAQAMQILIATMTAGARR